ncbi:hypothetical protein ILYODFUR_003785 [Ilyodon furcidens]|uniref:Uncharacterized protein n=1 Tax=Ilyodon furcidens TaxID=33524 RepID=A0ABV0U2G8_9TELE
MRHRAAERGVNSKVCCLSCALTSLKSISLMADVLLTELKTLSEILQNRKITFPKVHEIMTMYVKRIESLSLYPGHVVEASQTEEEMKFKGEQIRVGKSPIVESVFYKQWQRVWKTDSLQLPLTKHRPVSQPPEKRLTMNF